MSHIVINIFEDDGYLTDEAKLVFKDGICKVCGHYEGDHEVLDNNVWTCDDDCNQDLQGYCRASRVLT